MSRRNKKLAAWFAVAAAGTSFQFNGCLEFAASSALQSVDFCSVLNCEDGAFFNFCAPIIILSDCPAANVGDDDDDGG